MKWTPAADITIDIAPDSVTVSDRDTTPVVLAPVVYVAVGSSRLKVLSIGEPPPPGTAATRIGLFTADGPPPGISKLECLNRFFRYALKTVIDRHVFKVKPQVLIRGAERLSSALAGYERELLTQALEQAGARSVHWPDSLDLL